MDDLKRLRTPISHVYLRDGILMSEVHADDITLADLKVHNDMILKEYAGLLPLPIVVITKETAKQSGREIREFMGSEEFKRTTKSLATVTSSGLSRTLANLFLKFVRFSAPMKMFGTVEEALEWSQQYK